MLKIFESREKREEEHALVFNVGAGVIRGALVMHNREGQTLLKATKEKVVRLVDESDSRSLFLKMKKGLRAVTESLLKEHVAKGDGKDKAIHSVYCSYSPLYCVSQVQTFTVEKEQETQVTHKITDGFFRKERENLENSAIAEYVKKTDDPLRILDRRIVDLKLSGYSVDEPFGKYARDIEATLYLSLIPKKVLDITERTIEEFVHSNHLHFFSATVSIYCALRTLHPKKENYVVVDVSEESTEILVIKNKKLVGCSSFSQGTSTLFRNIKDIHGTTHQEVASRINLYLQDTAIDSQQSSVSSAVEHFGQIWRQNLSESLEPLEKKHGSVQSIFVLTPQTSNFNLIFERYIERYAANSNSIVDISSVHSNELQKKIEFPSNEAVEPRLALDVIYSGQLFSEHHSSI